MFILQNTSCYYKQLHPTIRKDEQDILKEHCIGDFIFRFYKHLFFCAQIISNKTQRKLLTIVTSTAGDQNWGYLFLFSLYPLLYNSEFLLLAYVIFMIKQQFLKIQYGRHSFIRPYLQGAAHMSGSSVLTDRTYPTIENRYQ